MLSLPGQAGQAGQSRGHWCSTVGQGAGAEPILLPLISPTGQELDTDPPKLQVPKGCPFLQAALRILLVCACALASLPTGRFIPGGSSRRGARGTCRTRSLGTPEVCHINIWGEILQESHIIRVSCAHLRVTELHIHPLLLFPWADPSSHPFPSEEQQLSKASPEPRLLKSHLVRRAGSVPGSTDTSSSIPSRGASQHHPKHTELREIPSALPKRPQRISKSSRRQKSSPRGRQRK